MSKTNVAPLVLKAFGDDRQFAAKQILKKARAEKLSSVLVIGRDDNGELWCSSSLNAGQSLWLLEKLRERILEGNPWSIL